jgi:hypothetical protein
MTYTAPLTEARIDAALPLMSEHDAATVRDIRERSSRYGGMTVKQMGLVAMLVARAERAAGKHEQPKIDLSRINQMFDKASETLKRPFVNFLVAGQEFKVSPAGAESRNPGFLYVKRGGSYQGKISPRGEFSASREAAEGILEALQTFAADPVKAAFAYGQETGSCCFCARELTDPRSVTVGYGPICADRFGLPWGA